MKIKLMKIIVCILLILPVFSFITVADPGPELEIIIVGSLLSSGYSNVVYGIISNIGDRTAYNITYEIMIQGRFNGVIYHSSAGALNEILPNYAFPIIITDTHGFCPVRVDMTASSSNAGTVTGTAKGFQLGGFTWIPFSWLSIIT